MRFGPWRIAFVVLALAVMSTAAIVFFRSRQPPLVPTRPPVPSHVRGVLRLGLYRDGGPLVSSPNALAHTSVYVNGLGYRGMQDNDIRGFLDGRFIDRWNQVGQIHVRTGRRANGAVHGEYGLFRFLQRWDEIVLPPAANVSRAVMSLGIESGPVGCWSCNVGDEHDVFLYAVHKDWNPGRGGTLHDNTSPPEKGDVWWGEVAYQERSWGLPGVGFASSDHPEADTNAMPLAHARYSPGVRRLDFSSQALSRYVQDRLRQRLPLLFLAKLGDGSEDLRGSQMGLYSADHGDVMNTTRRPSLRLEWSAGSQVRASRHDVFLEHGRSILLPRMDTKDVTSMAVSFIPEQSELPTIEMRGGSSTEVAEWRLAPPVIDIDWDWVEVRVLAAKNPVVLGTSFQSELRDTWVRTAPPDQQRVGWQFQSPTGLTHLVQATYAEDYRWKVTFEPTAIKTQIWALVTQKETEPCRRSRSRRGKTSGAQETSHGRDAV